MIKEGLQCTLNKAIFNPNIGERPKIIISVKIQEGKY